MTAVPPEDAPALVVPPSPPHPVALETDPQPVRRRPRRPINALAVAAITLAALLSPAAALFGHLAAGQIGRSRGRERGIVIAWVAVGLGYLWLIAGVVLVIAVWQVLQS